MHTLVDPLIVSSFELFTSDNLSHHLRIENLLPTSHFPAVTATLRTSSWILTHTHTGTNHADTHTYTKSAGVMQGGERSDKHAGKKTQNIYKTSVAGSQIKSDQ